MNETHEPFGQTTGPVAFIYYETSIVQGYRDYDIRYNTISECKFISPSLDHYEILFIWYFYKFR